MPVSRGLALTDEAVHRVPALQSTRTNRGPRPTQHQMWQTRHVAATVRDT